MIKLSIFIEDLVFTLFSDLLHICNPLEDCAKINLLEGFSSHACSLVDVLFQPILMFSLQRSDDAMAVDAIGKHSHLNIMANLDRWHSFLKCLY